MKAFLKLIRWQNLLIVILTMVLIRYMLLGSILSKINVRLYSIAGDATHMMLQMPLLDFILLVAATVLITAGGYVINDYFDIKTDLINKGKVIVGTSIPRHKAMTLHNVLNAAGVLAGFFVSFRAGYPWMGILFLIVSGLLYFYSASYKRQFLIGNIIVAILTAMVPMLVVFYEAPALYQYYSVNASKTPGLAILFWWVGAFAFFAFFTTLTREIVKDIEDFEGDLTYGRRTVPVVLGLLVSRIVAVSLIVVTIILLYIVWYLFVSDIITLGYLSIAITVPLLIVIWLITRGTARRQLHAASRLLKLVMIAGILYTVVVRILLTYNLV